MLETLELHLGKRHVIGMKIREFKLIFWYSYFLSSKEPKDPDQLYSTLKTILQQVKVSASSSLPSVKIFK